MKVALAIYLFLLAFEGGLAWLVGGSPFLLLASMVVVLVYAMLNIKLGQLAEITRLTASALLLGLCPMYYGNNPNAVCLCLLALPHLLSVTQSIWIIQSAGTTREVNSLIIKHSVFTLGFYATLGLAFLMLRADFLEMERSTGLMLATVISLLGLVAWEVSRVGHLKRGRTTHHLTAFGFMNRAALAGMGAVMFVLLLVVALPLASDALCYFSPQLNLPRDLTDPASLQLPETESGTLVESKPNNGFDPEAGPEMTNRTGQSKLPMRGKLNLTDEVRVVIKIKDPAQAETLNKQGLLYVRTLAVSHFKDGQWTSESPSGDWVKDSEEEWPDGRVVVSKPLPGEIAHEVFIPKSTGYVLPALAGVTTYGLPEVFRLSDHWFQNEITGDVRYKAWSKPVDMRSLSKLKIEPGKPGEKYLAKLDTPFGKRLTETADFIRSERPDLTGRLELLRQYFQTNFKYSLTVQNKSGRQPLENFLFEEKSGYCDFFASASALILRHMGIPSRVAYGYKDGEQDAAGHWIFREFHAHAWTEVFVEDHGWVICDFTPASTDGGPRSGAPLAFNVTEFKDAGGVGMEGGHKLWNKAQTLRLLGSPWLLGMVGFGLLVMMVGFLLGMRRTPVQRAMEKAARERTERDRQPGYLLDFLSMCEAYGHPRLKGQTLMEFHRRLKHLQFCGDDFDELTAYYYKSRYEDAPQDESKEQGFRKRIREFRNHLRPAKPKPSTW